MNISSADAEKDLGGARPPFAKRIFFHFPLRIKGLLAFFAVVIYATLLTTYTFHKKTELVNEFEHLRGLYEVEDQLRQVEAAAFHIVMAVFINSNTDTQETGIQRFKENFELLKRKNAELLARFPNAGVNLNKVELALVQAAENPSARGLAALNSELLKAKNEATQHIEESRQEQKATAENFYTLWDSAALASLMFGLFGLILLGAIIGLFFTRLTNDLHTLKARALDIINGDRNSLIHVSRNDEVGELMQAVNEMSYALEERERELVITRQRYFHQEKMAAVGALAAGVAHEIGNPIAAMSGVLQEMVDEQGLRKGGIERKDSKLVVLLQAQIQRLSAITREISGFAAPQPAERQLLDLNGLVRTTAGLMGYDKRMRQVKLRLNLDSQLPAIYGVADQITQVVMNLLINAADAMETVEESAREMLVCTETSDGNVLFSVIDHGSGMDSVTLNRAFEAFFTTKKSKGTGLGLALCYSIVTDHGGMIEVDSELGKGTTVRVILPLPAEDGGDTL